MFVVTLQNVLIAIAYMLPAFILGKLKMAKAEHLPTISSLLVYFLSPSMIIFSFTSMEFDKEIFKQMGLFAIATIVLQFLFMMIMYLIFKKKYEDSKYRILTVGSFLGNVGFFGLPIVRALFPSNPVVMCYSIIFSCTMNFFVFTMGVFCITGDKKYMSIKSAIMNPTFFTLLVAIPLYIFNVGKYFPTVVSNAFSLFTSMTTPVCMFILGIRLSNMSLKKVFTNYFAYIIVGMKMIIYPLFCFLCVYFLPVSYEFKVSILILAAAPCASFILSMSEIYKQEQDLSANIVIVSTILSFITMPLLTLLA